MTSASTMLHCPVSVVIPNYNGIALFQHNLGSVLACLRDGDELVIIDDASTDQSVQWLSGLFRLELESTKSDVDVWKGCLKLRRKEIALVLLVNHKNLRFGASVNRAVSQTAHSLVLLLNNDVSPHVDVLEYLLPHFEDHAVFAVGCHEKEANLGGISGGKNQLRFKRGMFFHDRAPAMTTGETAWASGGSCLLDKHKWKKLDGFDKDYYPAYWEDVDISHRARKKGWKVLFEAKAMVDHNHESTNADVFGQKRIEKMSWGSAQTFSKKHGSFVQKIQYWLWKPYYWWWWRRAAQS